MRFTDNHKLTHIHLNYLLRKRLFGGTSIDSVASKKIPIHPSESSYQEPAICLKNQEDKITGVHVESSKELELQRLRGGRIVHSATSAWVINSAIIKKRGVYKNGFHLGFDHVGTFENVSYCHGDEAPYVLTSSYTGLKYFGHWLCDDVPAYMLAETLGTPISLPSFPGARDKAFYTRVFEQNWNRLFLGGVKEILILDDIGLNANKLNRYLSLRSKLKEKYQPKLSSGYVYIRRGNTGVHASLRVIVNEEQLIESLKEDGFAIVDITKDTTQEMIECLLDAKLVVSLDGSHSFHALYAMSTSGGWIVIQPPDYFTAMTAGVISPLGIKYGYFVAERTNGGLYVSIDELRRTIDLTLNALI